MIRPWARRYLEAPSTRSSEQLRPGQPAASAAPPKVALAVPDLPPGRPFHTARLGGRPRHPAGIARSRRSLDTFGEDHRAIDPSRVGLHLHPPGPYPSCPSTSRWSPRGRVAAARRRWSGGRQIHDQARADSMPPRGSGIVRQRGDDRRRESPRSLPSALPAPRGGKTSRGPQLPARVGSPLDPEHRPDCSPRSERLQRSRSGTT